MGPWYTFQIGLSSWKWSLASHSQGHCSLLSVCKHGWSEPPRGLWVFPCAGCSWARKGLSDLWHLRAVAAWLIEAMKVSKGTLGLSCFSLCWPTQFPERPQHNAPLCVGRVCEGLHEAGVESWVSSKHQGVNVGLPLSKSEPNES